MLHNFKIKQISSGIYYLQPNTANTNHKTMLYFTWCDVTNVENTTVIRCWLFKYWLVFILETPSWKIATPIVLVVMVGIVIMTLSIWHWRQRRRKWNDGQFSRWAFFTRSQYSSTWLIWCIFDVYHTFKSNNALYV